MEDINHAAILAVGAAYAKSGHYMERFEAAWSAIGELVWNSPSPPPRREMVTAGVRAVNSWQRAEEHHHGDSRHTGAPMENFGRYWLGLHPRPSSPENRVVEMVAMCQIWPQLTDTDRAAIVALATHGTITEAARAVGVDARTFGGRVRLARARFLIWWHEGEEPSAVWRVDRRTLGGKTRVGAATAQGAGRERRLPGHGTETRYRKHGCRCRLCTDASVGAARARRRARGVPPKRRVTVSQLVEIRLLREGGKPVAEIAEAYGVGQSTLHALLRGTAQPAPDGYEGAAGLGVGPAGA